jgi:diadenosine tetraphosphatase ApaH/serine/threonine PP2A family protein phosphatase
VGQLEETDRLVSRVHVHPCRVDEPVQQRRPEHGLLDGHGVEKPDRVGVRVGRDEAPRVGLREAGADEDVLEQPAKALVGREVPCDRAPERERVRDPIEHRSRDLFDQVDLAGHVARPEGRDGHAPAVVELEPEPGEERALLFRRDVEPDQPRRALGTNEHDGTVGQAVVHVDRAGELRAGEVDEQTACEHGRRLGGVGIDALLPTCSNPQSGDRAAPRFSGRRSARSSRPRAAPRWLHRRPPTRGRP